MRILSTFAVSLLALGLMLNTGCEWTGGGGAEGFNTSQGAGVNINFSGVYDGTFGGRAVKTTSAGNITRLTIAQGGDTLDVYDNQGSKYTGKVGSPGSFVDLSTQPVIPAGVNIVQSQVSWEGKDEVANKQVKFVGIIHVVSVTDIKGNTSTKSGTSTDTKTSSDNLTTTINTSISTNVVNGKTITTTETAYDGDGNLVFQQVTTETVAPSGDKTTSTRVIVDNRSKTSSNTSDTTSTAQFGLTEANTQYRLEGTWVEVDGKTSGVDALSSGGTGSVTVNIPAVGGNGSGGTDTGGTATPQ